MSDQIWSMSDDEQLKYLRRTLDAMHEGFYAVDNFGVTTLCNAAFLRMLGYASANEVIGRKLHGEIHHTHPDGRPYNVYDCPIYNAANQGKSVVVENEFFYRKDGSCLPIRYRVEPIFKEGKPLGAVCTFIDLTEERQKEDLIAELRVDKNDREKRYSTLFNTIKQGFCVIELKYDGDDRPIDYLFLEVNNAFEQQTGLVDATGKTIKFLAPTIESYWIDTYAEIAENGETKEFEFYSEALSRWFEVYAFKPGAYNSRKVAILFSDITARKNAEIALHKSQAHLSLMVESAFDYAIISLNENGFINSWNYGAERIFGCRPEEMIGQPFEIIFTPEDRAAGTPLHEFTTAKKQGRAIDERWHLRQNGERFYASGILTAMHNEAGLVTGFVKIARDMTLERKAQEELIAARNSAEAANIAKTEFLANMSHEIRTPMNAIIGLSNILSMSQPLTQRQREFIKTLQLSADTLLSLINDLLDIAKIEARTVELEQIPLSMTQIMQEVISMMTVRAQDKGIKFTGEGTDISNRMFIGDPTRLRQIILNLCSNAIKFTDTGSVHVVITCEPTLDPQIETVYIAVTDTGIGIAPAAVDDIFQKFVQADTSINRKYGGTGLGLAITKTLTEIMGGHIQVTSEIGKGSTFKVCIPLKFASDQEIVTSNGSLSAILQNHVPQKIKSHILLVEDYPANIMVATHFLESFGYLVDVATNGNEAYNMIKLNKYTAALMDVQMHGMNGLEATRLIREHENQNGLPGLHIIGMTAHALAGDRERCLGAGMNDYISKPFNPDELMEKLAALVND